MATGDICIINEALIRSVHEGIGTKSLTDAVEPQQSKGFRRNSFYGAIPTNGAIATRYSGSFAIIKEKETYTCCSYMNGTKEENQAIINGVSVTVPAKTLNKGDRAWIKIKLPSDNTTSGSDNTTTQAIKITIETQKSEEENTLYIEIGSISEEGKITQIYNQGTFIWNMPIFQFKVDEVLSGIIQFKKSETEGVIGGDLCHVAGGEMDMSPVVPVIENGKYRYYFVASIAADAVDAPQMEYDL